jgi:hypothetical protein
MRIDEVDSRAACFCASSHAAWSGSWGGIFTLSVAAGLFFAYLTTLIVVLYDTYRPLRAARDVPRRFASVNSAKRPWAASGRLLR